MLSNLTTSLKYIIAILASILILLGFYVMLNITYPYFSFKTDIDFLLTKQSILHVKIWRLSFYLHISSSLLVLLFGWLQFVKIIIEKTPKFHRLLGKIYVLSVLLLCAPSGLIMGIYANGGLWSKLSFVIISVLWWTFTLLAYLKIRKGNVNHHIHWMIRSYALTLTALTLRLYVLVLPHYFILPAKEMYTLVAWLSWIPNLIIAEIMIGLKLFTWKHSLP